MKWIQRLLIVEDEEDDRENLLELFSSPEQKYVDAYGFNAFDCDVAVTGSDAEELLKRAVQTMRPYDVLILDLGLPPTAGARENKKVGIQILKSLDERACAAVVVESVHTGIHTFIDLLRARTAEFIPKPWESEEMFRTVVQALKIGRERQKNRYEQLVKDHEQWRLLQSRAQLADRMGRVVSDGVGKILDEVDHLTDLMYNRYQLDVQRDSKDPVCEAIQRLGKSARSTSKRFAEARQEVSQFSESLEMVCLEDAIATVVKSLWDGLVYRRMKFHGPSDGMHKVRTFRRDVLTVLEEVLFKAIEASKEGDELRCEVHEDVKHRTMGVSITDQTEPMNESYVKNMFENRSLIPEDGRMWGLSMAQGVAGNIGGRIEVRGTEQGNTVTFSIPVTADE